MKLLDWLLLGWLGLLTVPWLALAAVLAGCVIQDWRDSRRRGLQL